MKDPNRTVFREAVFARDGHKCVMCGDTATEAHHIIERRLWPDGGYMAANGVSVCNPCHRRCESTEFSVEDVRQAAGITGIVVPPSFYDTYPIDKWGNEIRPNGSRMPGPLWDDKSVQKVLATNPNYVEWSKYIKHPRIPHLSWSAGLTDDHSDFGWEHNFTSPVVVLEKMDGENTTMYNDHIHARALDYTPHESRNLMKKFWSEVCSNIPEGYRICGENVYAEHSIFYPELEDYFLGFGVWESLTLFDWDQCLEWFELIGVTPVRELGRVTDLSKLQESVHEIWLSECDGPDKSEGYVIRSVAEIHASKFNAQVGKYVRKNHVTTDRFWRHKPVNKNLLLNKETAKTWIENISITY